MAFRFNPFTGQFDVAGSSSRKWAFNPFTGKLDVDYDVGGYVFNPFTGTLDSVGEAPSPPTTTVEWSANNALEWAVGNYLNWG